ncbi:MAG: YbaB/EbfC family nucleoid-associated protein [Clostridiales bacterium]|jgi:DNA-binding YbaB/EbfC family protein|nr:YbaB/EbfC family nucleoid-associated protein [Clostridiales bacterium]
MGKKGGFPGGMGGSMNFNNMLKEAQKMQKKLMETQEELADKQTIVTSGGGAVSVAMNGKRKITSLTIKPEVVDPDDIEMLQDLVITAVNEAIQKIDDESAAAMSQFGGALGGLI